MLGKELDSGHDDPDLESGLPCDDGDEQPAQGRALRRSGSHLLSSVPRHARITVECVGLRAFVPVLVAPTKEAKVSSEAPKKGKTEQPKERQVLFDVSACVEPGEMLALMGPSGSGKSSLLTLLGGRSTARLEGSITFNGNRLGKAAKRKLGYVSQDDLLYAELTVYETLYFAAMLRLPRTWSHEAKLQRVQMVLAGLGLDKCRDTIIGNHMMRGVSGGERKRVSIGHELLINPSVIFLDEPTSGLDSTTALKLMHTLRSLASGGRTIITSIHQPSSRLYQQVDKLLLLAEGHTLYYGDAHVCAHWFGSLGQPVPFGVSTSDHVLDLACGDLPGRSREESQDILTYLTTSFRERKIGHGRHGILAEHLGREAILASATSRRDRLAALHFPASPSPFPDSGVPTTSGPPSEAQGDENMHLGFPATLAKSAPAGSTATSGDGKDRERGGAAAEGTRRADVCGAGPGRQSTLGLDSEASSPPRVAPRMNIQMSAAGAKEGATGKGIGSDLDVGLRRLASSSSGSPKKEQEQQQGEGDQEGKWGATWLDQVKYLTQRSLKTRRFSALSIQRMIECIVVGVLAGLFWFQAGAGDMDKQRVLDIGGLLFFEILFLSFSSLFQAIFNYPPEFLMLVKERQSGMYRLSAYYVARSLADLPMDCALPSILTWIMYWMAGLRISAAAFFANWGAVLLTVMLAQSIGLLIGATINNLKTCLTAATIIMLSIMLVGGYYVRGIPVWIAWLKYLSFIYYSWNLILHIEFNNRPMTPDSCIPASGSCTVGKAGVFDNDVDAIPVLESCVLVGMFVALRLATYWALNYKTTFKRKQE